MWTFNKHCSNAHAWWTVPQSPHSFAVGKTLLLFSPTQPWSGLLLLSLPTLWTHGPCSTTSGNQLDPSMLLISRLDILLLQLAFSTFPLLTPYSIFCHRPCLLLCIFVDKLVAVDFVGPFSFESMFKCMLRSFMFLGGKYIFFSFFIFLSAKSLFVFKVSFRENKRQR